jgi:hypothetical protein
MTGGAGGLYGGGAAAGTWGRGGAGGGPGLIVITYVNPIKNHLTAYDRTKLPGPVSGPVPA